MRGKEEQRGRNGEENSEALQTGAGELEARGGEVGENENVETAGGCGRRVGVGGPCDVVERRVRRGTGDGAATGLDEITAKGVYAAAKAVAELTSAGDDAE